MNIYITKANEDKLRSLHTLTMSGLINFLLSEYFKTHTPEGAKKAEPAILKKAKASPAIAAAVANPSSDYTTSGHCPGHDMKWNCGRPGCKYA